MKSMQAVVVGVVASTSILGSCMSRKDAANGPGSGSSMKSVTINQPDLKKEMLSSMSEDDKKKVMDSLVYSIAITAVQKDAKDDCDAGAVATKFNSEVQTLDKSTFDAIKVKRGCNYIVSMKVGAKSDDGKSIKSLYIASWDDKNPSLLSKEELEKAKPTAVVKLYVTAEGKKYWDADEIVTPGDSDTQIDPSLSRKFSLKADKLVVSPDDKGGVKASLDLIPSSAPGKDLYCGVMVSSQVKSDTSTVSDVEHILLVDADAKKSVVVFKAGAAASLSIKLSETPYQSAVPKAESANIVSAEVRGYCSEKREDAEATLIKCSSGVSVPTAVPTQCSDLNVVKK